MNKSFLRVALFLDPPVRPRTRSDHSRASIRGSASLFLPATLRKNETATIDIDSLSLRAAAARINYHRGRRNYGWPVDVYASRTKSDYYVRQHAQFQN